MSSGSIKNRIQQNNAELNNVITTVENLPDAREVKLFGTIAEMQAYTDLNAGDLAVVYKEELLDWDGELVNELKLQREFTLDAPFEYVYSGTTLDTEPYEVDGLRYRIELVLAEHSASITVTEEENNEETIVATINYSTEDATTYTLTQASESSFIEYLDFEGFSYYIPDYQDKREDFAKMFKKPRQIFSGLYIYDGTNYNLAKTQLTAEVKDLLTGKIAYGKSGIITGNDTVYNNLDAGKVFEHIFKLNSYNMYDTYNSEQITAKVYGKASTHLITSDILSNDITYLKENNNGDICMIYEPKYSITLDASPVRSQYDELGEEVNIVDFGMEVYDVDDDYYYLEYYLEYFEEGVEYPDWGTYIFGYCIYDKNDLSFVTSFERGDKIYNEIYADKNILYYEEFDEENETIVVKKYDYLNDVSTDIITPNIFSYECGFGRYENYLILAIMNLENFKYDVYTYDIENDITRNIIHNTTTPTTSMSVKHFLVDGGYILYGIRFDDKTSAYKVSLSGTSTTIYENQDDVQISDYSDAWMERGTYDDENKIFFNGYYAYPIETDLNYGVWITPVLPEGYTYDYIDFYISDSTYEMKLCIDINTTTNSGLPKQYIITDYTLDVEEHELIINAFEQNKLYSLSTILINDNDSKVYGVYGRGIKYENGEPTVIVGNSPNSFNYSFYDYSDLISYNIGTVADYDIAVVNTLVPTFINEDGYNSVRITNALALDELYINNVAGLPMYINGDTFDVGNSTINGDTLVVKCNIEGDTLMI